MESEPDTTPAEGAGRATAVVPFRSTMRRPLLVFWGLLAPGVFLAFMAVFGPLDDVWQSGRWGHYAVLLFQWPSLTVVYLFVVLGGWAMLLFIIGRPRNRWVLWGLLSGAVVWGEFLALWTLYLSVEVPFLFVLMFYLVTPLVAVLWVLPWVLLVQAVRTASSDERIAIVTLLLVLALCAVAAYEMILGFFLGGVLFSAPLLAFACYAMASRSCLKSVHGDQVRLSLKGLLGAFLWFSVHFAAWRYAVNQMLVLYAQAPKEEPLPCFIATAAARGHRGWVGSWRVSCNSGTRTLTRQLQRLKAFELVLAVSVPAAHRRVRRLYNWLGPRVARRICNAWMADAVFVLLKPLEWLAVAAVLPLAGVRAAHVRRLYEPDGPPASDPTSPDHSAV